MTLTTYGTKVDVRDVAPRDRHPLIFGTFRSLGTDEAMELLSDHDPRPLRDHFEAQQPGRFGWTELQTGPDVWRVRITKLAGTPASRGCCGGCGGE